MTIYDAYNAEKIASEIAAKRIMADTNGQVEKILRSYAAHECNTWQWTFADYEGKHRYVVQFDSDNGEFRIGKAMEWEKVEI